MKMSIPIFIHGKSIRDLAARHPLITFICLAYAISWAAWLLADRLDFGVVNGFELIGSAGPALAAIIVSTLIKPGPSGVPAGKWWWLFGLICILVLLVMAVQRLWLATGLITTTLRGSMGVAYPSLAAILLDSVAAVLIALLFSGVYSSGQGARDLLHSLDFGHLPVRWYWWVIAIGFFPAFYVLGYAISIATGLPVSSPNATGLWYWLALDALVMCLYGLIGGGGMEEPGWRGFALPMLQKRFSPLGSSLFLAVMWGFWHLPLIMQSGLIGVAVYLVLLVVPLTILFTAVYTRTGGSLPVVILLHISVNLTEILLPSSTLSTLLWIVPVLVIAFWMWRSPRLFAYHPMETREAVGKEILSESNLQHLS